MLVALFISGYRKRRRDLRHLAAMAVVEEKQPPTDGPYELSGTSHMNEMSSTTEVQNTGTAEIGRETDDIVQADGAKAD